MKKENKLISILYFILLMLVVLTIDNAKNNHKTFWKYKNIINYFFLPPIKIYGSTTATNNIVADAVTDAIATTIFEKVKHITSIDQLFFLLFWRVSEARSANIGRKSKKILIPKCCISYLIGLPENTIASKPSITSRPEWSDFLDIYLYS